MLSSRGSSTQGSYPHLSQSPTLAGRFFKGFPGGSDSKEFKDAEAALSLGVFPPLPPFSLFLPSASFYNLPCVADFIIDILLGSPSAEVRVPLYKAPLALFCLGPWVPVAVCGL